MTRSFALSKSDDDIRYYTFVKRLKKGDKLKVEEAKIHATCLNFVKALHGSTPNKLTLTASTEYFDGATKIFVIKSGFYRWDCFLPEIELHYGLWSYAEEQLNRFFPSANSDGLDKPHDLYIKFS